MLSLIETHSSSTEERQRKCCEIYNIEVRRCLVLYYHYYYYYYCNYCNYIITLVTDISSLYSAVWTFTRVKIFSMNHWKSHCFNWRRWVISNVVNLLFYAYTSDKYINSYIFWYPFNMNIIQKWNFPPHKDCFHVTLMPHCLHNRPFPALWLGRSFSSLFVRFPPWHQQIPVNTPCA